MARQLRFIHGADLHIGAPIRGLRAVPPAWAERLTEAIPRAYDRLVEAALRHEVDFVAISGDVFDTTQASYGDYLRFFRGLERLGAAGIPTYLCTGNHDPLSRWQPGFFELPQGVRMLSSERADFALFERDGEPLCVVGGRSYPNKVWAQEADIAEGVTRAAAEQALGPRAAEAPFGVGVLHTGLFMDPHKAPADPARLQEAGFDYWALGHIHRRYVDDEACPRVAFSGCIQGRDIKETGPRGVNLVTLTEGAPNMVEFVPTASVALEMLTVDVSGCATLSAVSEAVMRAQFRANGSARCEEMVSRVTLVGATALHEVLAQEGVLEDLRAALNDSYADFLVDALVDRTTLPLDKGALRTEGLFPAALMQAAAAQRRAPQAQQAMLQDAFMQAKVTPPTLTDEAVEQLVAQAEDLVLDLLVREG